MRIGLSRGDKGLGALGIKSYHVHIYFGTNKTKLDSFYNYSFPLPFVDCLADYLRVLFCR